PKHMILGLLNTESTGLDRFGNFRRTVFYQYPNGSAPLTAILSMLKSESTNDPEFTIYEKRFAEQRSTTASANSAGPFTAGGGGVDKTVGGFAVAVNDSIRIAIADSSPFRIGHIVQVTDVPNGAASAIQSLKLHLTGIVDATHIEGRALEVYASVSNDTDANSLEVLVIGNAAAEGQVGAALAPYQPPIPLRNYTQIFRTPFQFTGTVLKTGLKYDVTGPYKDKAKDACYQHAEEIEKGYIFGTKTLYINPVTGLPTRTTGGILWYLQQWELATANPYGRSGASLDSDDDKRIITNTSGAFSLSQYNNYMERLFRTTSNKANEKLVLCGSGFLAAINDLFVGKSVLTLNQEAKQKWGWDIVSHLTPFGTVHYRTHPLFSQNGALRYSALFLDVWNLIYRYMDGRDTTLLKMRQPNNADYREDEYFGEHGLELRLPESFMFIKNFRTVTP
ncbi:MAG: hypothetical protein ABI623_11905, partial [bacterium]